MTTVATVNVNGIRAAWRRGMGAWLDDRRPDVLCLQEVRAGRDVLAGYLGDDWAVVADEGPDAGRAGVAVAVRRPGSATPVEPADAHLGCTLSHGSGRWVEADVDVDVDGARLTVVSAYVHTGAAGTPRQDVKMAFLASAGERMRQLRAQGRRVVVAGDLNVAHREVDLKNWKGNRAKAGFLPQERTVLDGWLDGEGWVDLGRRLGGQGPGPYTWWSWRGRAYDNDAGWRIDYLLATPELAECAVKAEVDRAPTYAERWSDHAPVVAELALHGAPHLQGQGGLWGAADL